MTTFVATITHLLNLELVITLSGVIILVLILRRRYSDILLFTGTGIATALTLSVLKLAFSVPRPLYGLVATDTYRFPSGHAAFSAFLVSSIGYLFVRRIPSRSLRVATYVFGTVLVLAVGWSRIYLGVHHPVDIIAGYAVGVIWVALGATYMDRNKHTV